MNHNSQVNKNLKRMRRKARRAAMQALYQWHFREASANELIAHFYDEKSTKNMDTDYFEALVKRVLTDIENIDTVMLPYLDRSQDDLNPVELAILRLAFYEFLYQLDVPYKVVINEALELAKEFGAQQGYKYINGVLDAAAPVLRELEVKHNKET